MTRLRIDSTRTTRATEVRNLVILGGSGDVGQRLIRLFSANGEWKIWAVSRRRRPADSAHPNLVAMTLDVAHHGVARALPEDAIVINLTEATPPRLVAEILTRGGTFLDTSATPNYVDGLAKAADGKSGRLVTGVGTVPGLSTLMGADLTRDAQVRTVRIGLELGMGRHYGQAAAEWIFRTLGQPYDDPATGRSILPGTNPWRFSFAQNEAPRMALDVAFPDKGIFPNGRGGCVRHYLAGDPPLVTRFFTVSKWLGLGRWMAGHSLRLAEFSHWLPPIGPIRTRMAAVAFDGDDNEIGSHLFEGGDQADLTAAMILLVVEAVRTGDVHQTGGISIVDHLELAQALNGLRRHFPDVQTSHTTT